VKLLSAALACGGCSTSVCCAGFGTLPTRITGRMAERRDVMPTLVASRATIYLQVQSWV
jgi:hypothetical protein